MEKFTVPVEGTGMVHEGEGPASVGHERPAPGMRIRVPVQGAALDRSARGNTPADEPPLQVKGRTIARTKAERSRYMSSGLGAIMAPQANAEREVVWEENPWTRGHYEPRLRPREPQEEARGVPRASSGGDDREQAGSDAVEPPPAGLASVMAAHNLQYGGIMPNNQDDEDFDPYDKNQMAELMRSVAKEEIEPHRADMSLLGELSGLIASEGHDRGFKAKLERALQTAFESGGKVSISEAYRDVVDPRTNQPAYKGKLGRTLARGGAFNRRGR